ncbi:hypothetical protein [Paludisphaera mucosa]|uniref:Uncharacterized protein n=1 Tax=Paludisphaera mucosa TaxID=3030827 RepID=A0ABT6FAH7_9BACT|nr:hypothetical protein [Paludisphaera mucosa]MDG3004565.1 hypothetical protein [Paludisphaera mucosa]
MSATWPARPSPPRTRSTVLIRAFAAPASYVRLSIFHGVAAMRFTLLGGACLGLLALAAVSAAQDGAGSKPEAGNVKVAMEVTKAKDFDLYTTISGPEDIKGPLILKPNDTVVINTKLDVSSVDVVRHPVINPDFVAKPITMDGKLAFLIHALSPTKSQIGLSATTKDGRESESALVDLTIAAPMKEGDHAE